MASFEIGFSTSPASVSLQASVSARTGFTPNYLTFGEEVNMVSDIMLGVPQVTLSPHSADEHMQTMWRILGETFAEVRVNIGLVQTHQKKVHDVKVY